MANTSWNPSDKSANITLSGNNLIATSVTISMVTARAVNSQTSGKYYWECLCNTFTSGTSAVGMAPSTASLTAGIASGGSSAGTFGLNRNGAIIVSSVASGVTFGTITSGSLVCLAVDLSAQRVWCRLGAAGNWNNNVANDPATGVGGVAITLGAALAGFPAVSLFANGEQVTANFGDSAFSGVVPSGFTAGFPETTLSLSGVREMAFTSGSTVVLGAGATVALPAAVDVSGNTSGFTLYSHMRVPGGTTYTFDTGTAVTVPATTDSVIAIPPAARFITATAASTVQFGQSL